MINDPHLLFKKHAIVLFNLGGPSSLNDVDDFLFNLFSDKAIIRLPNPFRYMVAKLISKRRSHSAKEIYSLLNGGSPILPNTIHQASALQNILSSNTNFSDGKNHQYRVFVCMRYSSPRAEEVVREIKSWNPDQVILLPLYPQYSTTTTESSFMEWFKECKKADFSVNTRTITEYYNNPNFVAANVDLIKKSIPQSDKKFRILFSAHGLPQKIVDRGDPYQKQITATVESVMSHLPTNIDYSVCYQSKVGPLKWLTPSTEEEIVRAGKDCIGIVVVPIAFVSDHSETLVELDIEYRQLAKECKVPFYIRVPVVGTHFSFIEALRELVHNYS